MLEWMSQSRYCLYVRVAEPQLGLHAARGHGTELPASAHRAQALRALRAAQDMDAPVSEAFM